MIPQLSGTSPKVSQPQPKYQPSCAQESVTRITVQKWTQSEKVSLLQSCKRVPIEERKTLRAAVAYLLKDESWKKAHDAGTSIQFKLALSGLKGGYTNNDIDGILSPSSSKRSTASTQRKPLIPAQSSFNYKNAKEVFKIRRLTSQASQHICTMWQQIPEDVMDIGKRIDSFCQFTSYSQDTLIALLTPKAIAFQKKLDRQNKF